MASVEDHIALYNDDEDEDDVLDDDVAVADRFVAGGDGGEGDSSDSDETNSTSSAAFAAVPLSSSSAVSIAAFGQSSSAPINGSDRSTVAIPSSSSTAIVAMPAPSGSATKAGGLVERKPFDDSRKLFQKLWADEDEIELLRGFLEYNTHRGPNWSGHHHDTTAFYDQIKSKIQLDCNKSQLVEKLRRLKKKYRTVVTRISSGKEFVFKCPHDQTLFEISRKIWGNSTANRPELDDDDQNPNPTGTPAAPTPNSMGDQRAPTGFSIDINSPEKTMMMNMGTPNRSRKRSRMQAEEKSSINLNAFEPVNVAPSQGSMEETIRSCLTPIMKDFIGNYTSGSSFGSCGVNVTGSLVSNAVPMNFSGVNVGNCENPIDERWMKQLILELEVYSKRLELVQDQIKLSLEDLRSRGS